MGDFAAQGDVGPCTLPWNMVTWLPVALERVEPDWADTLSESERQCWSFSALSFLLSTSILPVVLGPRGDGSQVGLVQLHLWEMEETLRQRKYHWVKHW